MNWLKSTSQLTASVKISLASVAGTQEPIYGPTAIQSVAEQTKKTSYTELAKVDLKWKAMQSTCVETQTFYIISEKGDLAMVQVIYSNVAGLHTTCQFNTKLYSLDKLKPHKWYSDPVQNHLFDEDMLSFGGDNVAVTLNEDGTAYTIKSALNENSLVNLTITRVAPGFVAGNNGTSNFGIDPKRPWGTMRHAFWPQCKVEGSIITPDGEVNCSGRGFFVHALQGMKPHHLAARWNFVNFQSPSYTAFLMEYTTPPSYGSTVVNVGAIVKDGEIIYAGTSNTASHEETAPDLHNDWPEPKTVKFTWSGQTKDGKDVNAVIEGPLGQRLDRVDVMAEVPGVVKSIIGSVAGTKPYIYQFSPQEKLSLKLRVGDTEVIEEGTLYVEATFIS
ncbi:Putative cell survival pathways protein [Emydomyces testavorans]|uniref:Cell survival pathways protein n=1 Tax=Emydomyces testavorans TaxID=2070801 RepID=A0AAF0DLF4_9EURO|nr:Putative cell survival pathways protein [Emydomyces testavorans]